MNVTVETKGACRRLVKVEFSAEEIQAEYDEWLQVYQRQGKVKGFRPGKAPPELVQRIYNKEILENMRDPLVAKGYQQAVKEHHLANSVAEMDLQLSELKA
ncbi:MAG TPA: trigger factor family protein, partial [Kiritimatiellia bacterium]|nr:trigger factor family protein [Kiritimatiellia bacterium]